MGSDVGGIVLLYEGKIHRFFHSRIASPEDAEDLTAEAVCAVIDGFTRFRGRSAVSTWIYAICRNVLFNYYARKRRERHLVQRAQFSLLGQADGKWILQDAVGRLPPLYRKLYEEYYTMGRKVKDIGALMGKPEGTVKYLLYDLRRRLRRIAGSDGSA
jgi:RNA polymerase sigma-70 factor (ECF subfamily)